MVKEKTIIYYTDNKLDKTIKKLCRQKLVEAAGSIPIISVSQKPIDLGKNICVGNIGSSWLNLYKQLLAGVKEAKTKYIATAEHDCLYTNEHFSWIPPRDDTFYYNENCRLVEWGGNHPELNGMYSSYWKKRMALSQLICNRELLQDTLEKRLALLDEDFDMGSIISMGEPGVSRVRIKRARELAKSGKSMHLQGFFKKQLESEKYDTFNTKIPNLDIRHNNNFTGPKRGKKRVYDIEYWGKFKDLICQI